jgi:hypothetical protein
MWFQNKRAKFRRIERQHGRNPDANPGHSLPASDAANTTTATTVNSMPVNAAPSYAAVLAAFAANATPTGAAGNNIPSGPGMSPPNVGK